MVDDDGTLCGIARMFYGDAAKWRRIYEANRKIVRNPDVIDSGIRLIIPPL
jgi:nucleoid-associated protein YgaU